MKAIDVLSKKKKGVLKCTHLSTNFRLEKVNINFHGRVCPGQRVLQSKYLQEGSRSVGAALLGDSNT
jgi:hypothetical protein